MAREKDSIKGAQIVALLQAGKSYLQIKRELHCSASSISYQAKRIGHHPIKVNEKDEYDWDAIAAYYNEGHSFRECCDTFHIKEPAWTKAVHRGIIKVRGRARPLEFYLVKGRKETSRVFLRNRLLNAGIFTNTCAICGVTEWMGKPLVMELDHINGESDDNRLENLRMLCPNCHSQTDTFCGKNVKRKKEMKILGVVQR